MNKPANDTIMPELSGISRTVVNTRYALLTPSGFVASALPGWEQAACYVLVSPVMGARFSQMLVHLNHDGKCQGNTGANQYFIFVVEGSLGVLVDAKRHRLDTGGYVHVPPGKDMQIKSGGAGTRVLIFQKQYQPLPGIQRPDGLVANEREVKGQPYLRNEDVRLQQLLPAEPAYDLAVNILSFQPGAGLPSVGSQIMEHGLFMLRGQGIWRLEADWHPVQAGDVIWTSPYCPQWFVAIGKTGASFLCYLDVNRDPI